MFSLYAEGTRPDLDVVPAQHLWEPSVLRRLRGLPLSAAADALWPVADERAQWAATRQQALFAQRKLRPLYVEHLGPLPDSELVLDHVPLVGMADGAVESAAGARALAELERARFGEQGPQSSLARELWASAHDTLGEVYLRQGHGDLAVTQYARAVTLTPLGAAAVSNLGVALEQRGDLDGALKSTAHAVELDPSRATPWVNLARLLWKVHGPEAARAALIDASRFAVRDPRLDEITRRLEAGAGGEPRQGTTR
jgi:tetratricopeptide (TPR) repeat protein